MKKNLMKEAHKMTREIKAQYPEVDYKTQLGLCLSYLSSKEEEPSLETVEKAADKYVKENCCFENGWFAKYQLNNWQKGNHNRTYVEIREYRKGSLRKTTKCGYWDHNTNEYVTYDRYSKVLDLTEYM